MLLRTAAFKKSHLDFGNEDSEMAPWAPWVASDATQVASGGLKWDLGYPYWHLGASINILGNPGGTFGAPGGL